MKLVNGDWEKRKIKEIFLIIWKILNNYIMFSYNIEKNKFDFKLKNNKKVYIIIYLK